MPKRDNAKWEAGVMHQSDSRMQVRERKSGKGS